MYVVVHSVQAILKPQSARTRVWLHVSTELPALEVFETGDHFEQWRTHLFRLLHFEIHIRSSTADLGSSSHKQETKRNRITHQQKDCGRQLHRNWKWREIMTYQRNCSIRRRAEKGNGDSPYNTDSSFCRSCHTRKIVTAYILSPNSRIAPRYMSTLTSWPLPWALPQRQEECVGKSFYN